MKNGRKRLTALILSGIMAASMGTNAFAESVEKVTAANEESDGDAYGNYLDEILPKKLSEENVDILEVIREYASKTIPYCLSPLGLNGEYDLSEPSRIHNWGDGEDPEKYMVIVSENNVMVGSLTAEHVEGRVIDVFRKESIPAINEALASGAEIRLGYSHDCFLVYTRGKLTVVENEYSVDESFVDQLALDLAQADKDNLSAQETASDQAVLDFVKKALPGNLVLFDLDPDLVDISNVYSMNAPQSDGVELYLCFALADGQVIGEMVITEHSDGEINSSFSLCSYPEVDQAAAEGKPIGFIKDNSALYLLTKDSVTLIDREFGTSDSEAVARRAKGIPLAKMKSEPLTAQLDKDGLSAEERKLIALAGKDHSKAVRYYHENMIYSGIYGTTILGENSENELSLLSENALIYFDKSAGKEAEDQVFRLYVYTDQRKRYMIKVPTRTQNLYTAAELLDSVPKDEKIVFAVFHYQSYEYADEKVSIRISEYAEPWAEIDGSRYYIKSDGTVLTKAAVIDGIRYKFDQSGVCQGKFTGITKSDKGRRYWKDGTPVKNKWIRVKGERKYYAGADGYFVTGTREINGKEYAFAGNGALKK